MATGHEHLRALLVRLSRAMRLLEKSEGGCCGVTLAQCHMLVETGRAEARGALSVGEMAQVLGVDLSTASRVADGLVRQQLLQRTPSPTDRRRVVLTLTSKGKRLVDEINSGMNDYASRVLAALPRSRRQNVLSSLQLLAEALEQAWSSCGDQPAARER